MKWTNQYSGKTFDFVPTVAVSNGRYQKINLTPPSAPNAMQEGLYLVEIKNASTQALYATRLAFVSSVPAFSEVTYTSYTEGDNDAYTVYTP